jgi:DNA repair exonuclease SbcCD ATPase subunit
MKGPRARALNDFKMMCEYYDVMHFEKYYEYNNLPQTVRNRLDSWMSQANSDDDKLEVRTGIVSIEQAIAQYINKYARTTKVYDLVHSFNEKLNELAAVAHLEDAIRKDKDAKAKIEEQIAKIKENIQSAQNAQKRSKAIDKIDLTSTIEKQVATYMTEIKNKLSRMMSGRSNKVEKIKAKQQCEELEKECKAISVQIKVQIDKILETAYKDTITKIVEDYKRYLAELNIGVDTSALSFNPANLVSGSLSDLSSIIDDNTETVDESYYDDKYRWVPSKKKWYNPFSWFNEGAHWEGKTIEKYVDYVDMNEVASDYIVPFQKSLDGTKKDAINHVKSETQRLKEHLKSELAKIDKVLNQKLDALSKTEADNKAKAEEIAEKEKNLKWLESIQSQVNNIINF